LNFSFDESDGFVVPENLPPLMSVALLSRDVLEMTVTKTFLGVLNTLNQSFNQIGDQVPILPNTLFSILHILMLTQQKVSSGGSTYILIHER
jgi:hypothetical protein